MNLLAGFGIKNYLSFDDEGIYLNDLKKINLIIGRNNCGKSNILKLIKSLKGALGLLNRFPSGLADQHHRNGKTCQLIFKLAHSELHFQPTFEHYDDVLGDRITKKITLWLPDPLICFYDLAKDKIEIILKDKTFDHIDNHEFFTCLGNAILRGPISHEITHDFKAYMKTSIRTKIESTFKDVLYIPDFRIIDPKFEDRYLNSKITSRNIIGELFKMKNPKTGEEHQRKSFQEIERKIQELLAVEELEIDIPHTQDEIILNIDGNRLPLGNFGTGIHEIIMLCCTLLVTTNHLICIEEPEIHLHPDLQRRFINLLASTNNQYLITTHSNIFLDYAKENTSIYHCFYEQAHTKVEKLQTNMQVSSMLADLGYKNSDLMHSNCIVWVEGPSDRIYLNKWINLMDPSLREGFHYSIMFYGGRLLSHLSCDLENMTDELIALLKINKHACVVIDSDITKKKKEVNKTKQRIAEQIGIDNCWITRGKEIENYLPVETINKWLKKTKRNEILSFYPTETISQAIQRSNSGFYFERDKVQYAKEIAELITPDDISGDLQLKLKKLVKIILNWN